MSEKSPLEVDQLGDTSEKTTPEVDHVGDTTGRRSSVVSTILVLLAVPQSLCFGIFQNVSLWEP